MDGGTVTVGEACTVEGALAAPGTLMLAPLRCGSAQLMRRRVMPILRGSLREQGESGPGAVLTAARAALPGRRDVPD